MLDFYVRRDAAITHANDVLARQELTHGGLIPEVGPAIESLILVYDREIYRLQGLLQRATGEL